MPHQPPVQGIDHGRLSRGCLSAKWLLAHWLSGREEEEEEKNRWSEEKEQVQLKKSKEKKQEYRKKAGWEGEKQER